ncbi:hypothetical protein [Bathymodiolus heckerae thiotrophic gill symbiont]|uniref:hypothetical protein n=1 Tax=Bathymodiolus heckerae thiotrophic gill symbiont TaxID=1052212 RepID=UPI0014852E8F|nr:hypothetical protein [Bathymodiolus heckerae thiotrophic gill symbiont]
MIIHIYAKVSHRITNQGMATDNKDFIAQIKNLTGYNVTSKNKGRSKGWQKKNIIN